MLNHAGLKSFSHILEAFNKGVKGRGSREVADEGRLQALENMTTRLSDSSTSG